MKRKKVRVGSRPAVRVRAVVCAVLLRLSALAWALVGGTRRIWAKSPIYPAGRRARVRKKIKRYLIHLNGERIRPYLIQIPIFRIPVWPVANRNAVKPAKSKSCCSCDRHGGPSDHLKVMLKQTVFFWGLVYFCSASVSWQIAIIAAVSRDNWAGVSSLKALFASMVIPPQR